MAEHRAADNVPGTSDSGSELEDLNVLSFPDDIDWSTTLILRCDPKGAPYKLVDVTGGLHSAVHRNTVHNLGPTALSHVFTISFKTERATEMFVRYLKDSRNRPLTVKGHPCVVSRIPSRCVTVTVRWIPVEVDSVHVLDVLERYGKVVKSELVQSDHRGWFHVYTGERKFQLLLHEGVEANSLPYSIDVKGLYGAVHVEGRSPKCLDCYFVSHKSDSCKYKGCLLYRGE